MMDLIDLIANLYRHDAIDACCEHECGKRMIREICDATDCGTIFDDIQSAQQWIPVSERLPEKDGHYIVYAPTYSGGSSSSKEYHDGVMFSAFKKGKWSIEHGYHKRPNCVVAWMPLPTPYQESEVE